MEGYSRKEIEMILERYGDMVYRMAIVQMKKSELADDIYQEVWLRLIRQRVPLESEEHLKAWLLRTTIHCCRDHWKSAWVCRIVWLEQEQMIDQIADAAMHVGQDIEVGPVTACVQRLPEKYRTVIHLHYYEGYHLKEIASLVGSNENTVASWLARGRHRLKQLLSEEERKSHGD